ncbi:MAG: type II secretion system minor pseudopilin GspK [Rhodoferax sp.]|nr:type II secretion system minor pseudopilin GspK [Rhodoferax sp.]
MAPTLRRFAGRCPPRGLFRLGAARRRNAQRGAAILTAMLTVTLVAALSASALWQQWRGIEVETAERERQQAAWILQGALDWARLILREDARSNSSVDHLAEPWAVPLQEARLSTFLATSQSDTTSGGLEESFLSGQIVDLQGRLNVMNLVQDGKVHAPTARAFSRLFETLRLPQGQLVNLVAGMRAAMETDTPDKDAGTTSRAGQRPLLPRTTEQLVWLGLSKPVVAALRPFVTVLPKSTTVNLNTAPVEVVYASITSATMADAQRLVAARAQSHFRSLPDVNRLLGGQDTAISETLHGVNSSFFEVSGQVRLGDRSVLEHSLVQRDSLRVTVLWRERGTGAPNSPQASLQ